MHLSLPPHRLTLDDVPIDVADTLPLDSQTRAFVAAVRGDNVLSKAIDLALAVRVAEVLTTLGATLAIAHV
ncbi:hypothetical protein O7602_30055 [Micromonospora sp. WMMD1128]|uniref:hypothetical protein n=1 Tax=unclassified Micromonospora TaxID=2617518 RepID=UPI00248AAD0F|nr:MULTISPECIES: hypothetical protein [unclassified Micromonospora]WBB73841.1 hypothetical protein O7602_30055 [Micromonospora sp. WMMD1128]WFE32754.1 hypothetical protein O7613_24860 [Micromonospora sp. WMMD975]